MPPDRLQPLDGLRGIAILLVIGFHYFYAMAAPANTTTVFPYGDAFIGVPIFKYGYLGVELFFIISGFVIALTLETCATPLEFAIRRFARLWPPLLICSIATFVIVKFLPTPFSLTANQGWANFLPSLTLTPAPMWSWVSPHVELIDIAYWSLVVEVRFYILAAALFWICRRGHFSVNLVIFTCLNLLIKTALKWLYPQVNDIYSLLFIPSFLPWFAIGAVFHDLYRSRVTTRTAIFLLLPMLAIIARYSLLEPAERQLSAAVICAAAVVFTVIVWAVASRKRFSNIFKARALVWLGACSYSAYLLHFGIGMAALSVIPKAWPISLQVALALLVIGGIICVSRLSFEIVECRVKSLILRALLSSRN
jgi:peptidoglycan/LPS O-acetylase OafA/YrhL